MHRKIAVIDETLTLVGTANFTPPSLKMHSNLFLGIWDPSLAKFLSHSIEEEGIFQIGEGEISSFLLPEGGKRALEAIAEEIDRAQERIDLAIFTLTHPLLIEKLIEANDRGVEITVAIDRYTSRGASRKGVEMLEEHGMPVRIHTGGGLLHHKWALIDGKTLIIGSANWTRSAFAKNQDCLLICKDFQDQAKIYKKIWNLVLKNSQINSPKL